MAAKGSNDNGSSCYVNMNENKVFSSNEHKVIESVIKLLQKSQGFLSLLDIHQHLLTNETILCQVFNFSSDGLFDLISKAILQGGPTYFHACIVNDLLYLISVIGKKKMKTIVRELSSSNPRIVMYSDILNSLPTKKKAAAVDTVLTAKVLITCINILEGQENGLPIDELYRLLISEREEEMRGTVLENSLENFKQFIIEHPVELSLTSDGSRVFSLADINSDDVAKAVLGVRMAVLFKGGLLNVKNLVGHLSGFASVRAVTGGSVESLQKFILQHPEAFLIDSNGNVSITGGKVFPGPSSSKNTVENDKGNSTQKQVPKVTKAKVKNDDKTNSKLMTKLPVEVKNKNESKKHLRYCQSVVVTMFSKFGLIQNGQKEDENIYFDSSHFDHSSYSLPVDKIVDLKTYLKVGDKVDCLFNDDHSTSHNVKFKACIVWKVPNGLRNDLCLLPVYEFPFNVLVGSSTVSFLNGSVGSCKVFHNQKDSLIDFDAGNKNGVSTIGFHQGWLLPSKNLIQTIKLGSQISFIAKPIVQVSGSLSSHWVAISVWNKKILKNSIAGQTTMNKRVVKAEVKKLTSDGGVMSFGDDLWTHRAAFLWETLADTISKLLILSVGDSYWCVISEANESGLGSTKWIVNQLVPYNVNDNGKPPLILRQYPFENLSSNSLSLLNLSIIDIFEDHTTLPVIAKSAEMTNSTTLFDTDLIDLSNLTSNLSFSCTSLSGIGLSEYKSNLNDREYAVIEDGGGTIVSKDVYGGMIEGDDKNVVYFGAHAFYLNGKAISHLAFPERTRVHYQAKSNPTDLNTLVADKVWIGKKPL